MEEDFSLLKDFIIKHHISKIHVYGLNPIKGTSFEKALPPTKEEQAWWIAQLRIAFPKLDIQCGIWLDRVDYVPLLLKAGANSVSKLPAIKKFGSVEMGKIEEGAESVGRKFRGTLTSLPSVDWDKEVDKLDIDECLKKSVKVKLKQYLGKMGN